MAKDKKKKNKELETIGVPTYAITEARLREMINAGIKVLGNPTAWAKDKGVTPQQVSAFMLKRQNAGLKIPLIFGYKPQTVYIPINEEIISTPAAPRMVTKNPTAKVDHTKPPIVKRGYVDTSKEEQKEYLKERKEGKKKDKKKKKVK